MLSSNLPAVLSSGNPTITGSSARTVEDSSAPTMTGSSNPQNNEKKGIGSDSFGSIFFHLWHDQYQ
jgi:hypothetical protein